jgi:hypothetical protein
MEDELFFKRFPADRQDQVRALVEYATLMGLTGKDLVSIGGKLDRLKVTNEIARNKEIIAGFKVNNPNSDYTKFSIKTTDSSYRFEEYGNGWRITSSKTKAHVRHNRNTDYALPNSYNWDKRKYCSVLLDIANGKLQLNF